MFVAEVALERATGGRKIVGKDWVSGSALRPLIQNDPCLVWLRFHGVANGFEQDDAEYSFLDWIGEKGRQFEAAWIKNVAPEAVQAMDDDKDVRHVESLKRTLDLMARRVPVISKAAVWDADARVFGSCDLICLTSWLVERFPWLKPTLSGPDIYQVLDCKFTTGMDKSSKKTDLAINSAQVRMYSFALGKMQGAMPEYAYLITRDRIYDPLPVPVYHRLDGPLDPKLAALRDLFIDIKTNGHTLRPWRDKMVAPNFSNRTDEPWHDAKKQIVELMPAPLEKLPNVGALQAKGLREFGFDCLSDLLCPEAADFPFHVLRGLGGQTGARIRAVLEANRTGKPTVVPAELVPRRRKQEFYCDYEYLSSANVDFEEQWPTLEGCEMVFMVGCGWEENGRWQYEQFTAAREDHAAEKTMFTEFLAFLDRKGVLRDSDDVVLWHWSQAEVHQSQRAAQRLDLPRLSNLPWADLQRPFRDGPIAFAGMFDFGLKTVTKCLGEWSPEHAVHYPEGLGDGMSAMTMAWSAYSKQDPLGSHKMQLISQYLSVDCHSLYQVLRYLRDNIDDHIVSQCTSGRGGWYRSVRADETESVRNRGRGWYALAWEVEGGDTRKG